MTHAQKKALLKNLQNAEIITTLRRPELLMDFLTDCLTQRPTDLSLAVPALQGLFTLITVRNLDYPAFYTRLYGLLDQDILHSKYRSRFFRHLDTFLAPTNHLPATTIASFVKRLARLALWAPPAAIVAIVPFTYNLLKAHPSITFMLHRPPHPPYTLSEDNIGEDPYDQDEEDPQSTGAIDSSLWELETLRSHYHPTVASIVRIVGEQFTKQQYNLEDFLDHGYGTLAEGELKEKQGKRKREAVVEYRIPQRVFEKTAEQEGDGEENNPVLDLWSFD